MSVKWLVEDFARDNSFGLLAEEVKRQGMECRVIRYEPFESGSIDSYPHSLMQDNDPINNIIFQGSIQLANQIKKEKPNWYPGVWANWEAFKCSTFYAHWGKYLLNDDYVMMPFAELKRRHLEILSRLDNEGFFIRPDSNQKTFSATVLTKDKDFSTPEKTENTWKGLLYDPPAEELVVVAPIQRIHKEWRVICTKGEVVTGSRYKTWGQVDYKAELPNDVHALALEICSGKFQPDPMYVLDICDSPLRKVSITLSTVSPPQKGHSSKIVSHTLQIYSNSAESSRSQAAMSSDPHLVHLFTGHTSPRRSWKLSSRLPQDHNDKDQQR